MFTLATLRVSCTPPKHEVKTTDDKLQKFVDVTDTECERCPANTVAGVCLRNPNRVGIPSVTGTVEQKRYKARDFKITLCKIVPGWRVVQDTSFAA